MIWDSFNWFYFDLANSKSWIWLTSTNFANCDLLFFLYSLYIPRFVFWLISSIWHLLLNVNYCFLIFQRMWPPFLPIAHGERVVEGVEGFKLLMVYDWSCHILISMSNKQICAILKFSSIRTSFVFLEVLNRI